MVELAERHRCRRRPGAAWTSRARPLGDLGLATAGQARRRHRGPPGRRPAKAGAPPGPSSADGRQRPRRTLQPPSRPRCQSIAHWRWSGAGGPASDLMPWSARSRRSPPSARAGDGSATRRSATTPDGPWRRPPPTRRRPGLAGGGRFTAPGPKVPRPLSGYAQVVRLAGRAGMDGGGHRRRRTRHPPSLADLGAPLLRRCLDGVADLGGGPVHLWAAGATAAHAELAARARPRRPTGRCTRWPAAAGRASARTSQLRPFCPAGTRTRSSR